jgi:hypothetical protein
MASSAAGKVKGRMQHAVQAAAASAVAAPAILPPTVSFVAHARSPARSLMAAHRTDR